MGNCNSNNEYKVSLKQIEIPFKDNLSEIYTPTSIVFFKNDIMMAYKAIIKNQDKEVVIKKLAKSEITRRLFL